MCGICGFTGDDKKILRSMTRTLQHRGPDAVGYYSDLLVSLGHRRLSIIDLSKAGKQPMSNEDGTVWITFNGEIYNYQEIKALLKKHTFVSKTDTEVLVHGYEEFGAKLISKLEGDFAFCIYDQLKKQLLLARDPLGVKPLYYFYDREHLIFASEMKAILAHPLYMRSLNKEALNQWLSMRYVPGEQTLFSGIKRMLPGHFGIFDLKTKTLSIEQYWDIEQKNTLSKDHSTQSEHYYVRSVRKLFEESVKKRLMADVPLGVYLSGGIDSTSIVAMMHHLRKKEGTPSEIKTFSVGFEEGTYANELPIARKTAELYETKHTEIFIKKDIVSYLPKIIAQLDEPLADPALLPVYQLSKQATKDVTVVLTGDGGDEVFAGYDQYKFLLWAKKLKHIPLSHKVSALMKLVPQTLLDHVYKYSSKMGTESYHKIDGMIAALKRDNPAKAYQELVSVFTEEQRKQLVTEQWFKPTAYHALNNAYFKNNHAFLNQLLKYDIKLLLPDSYLVKTDGMTMAHGIEARVPLLDRSLVSFAYHLPWNMKYKSGVTKYVLKKALEPYVPKTLLAKKKQTFHVPIEAWFKGALKETASLLDEKELKAMGTFHPVKVREIVQKAKTGQLHYAREAWSLLCFKQWYEDYLNHE